jgi:hypothetical protein
VPALILVGWNGHSWLTAPGRLSPELRSALATEPGAYRDISVSLACAPRQFQIRLFQCYGTFAGVNGTTVMIRRVATAQIREISRTYWIDHVDLASLP